MVDAIGYMDNDPDLHPKVREPHIQETYEVRKAWMKSKFSGAAEFMQMRLWGLKSQEHEGKTLIDHSNGEQTPNGYRVIDNEFPYAFSKNTHHFLIWDPTGMLTLDQLEQHLNTNSNFLSASYHVVNDADELKRYVPSSKFPYDFTSLKRGTDYVMWDNPDGSIPALHHLHIVIDESKPNVRAQRTSWYWTAGYWLVIVSSLLLLVLAIQKIAVLRLAQQTTSTTGPEVMV